MTQRQILEKRLDDLIRDIIKGRDTGSPCITCGKTLTTENITAGHFMKRRHLATRWNTLNVNGQCWKCNGEDDTDLYEEAMIRRYGATITENIKKMARSAVHYTNEDLTTVYHELKRYQEKYA